MYKRTFFKFFPKSINLPNNLNSQNPIQVQSLSSDPLEHHQQQQQQEATLLLLLLLSSIDYPQSHPNRNSESKDTNNRSFQMQDYKKEFG